MPEIEIIRSIERLLGELDNNFNTDTLERRLVRVRKLLDYHPGTDSFVASAIIKDGRYRTLAVCMNWQAEVDQ